MQTMKKKRLVSGLAMIAVALAFAGALSGGTPHTQQQAPPIKLGTSGSNVNDINSSFCCTGTLGAQVKDAAGNKYILSNNHVLARSNAGVVGEAIMHRGYVDTVPPCSTTGAIVVANLSNFVPLNFAGGNNVADAAIAQVVAGQVNPNGAILELGIVSRMPVAPAVGMAVRKSGRTTGLTTGSIATINVTVNVSGYGPCGLGTQLAKFVKQFSISSTTFSAGGDSGSLIVKTPAAGQRANPVGLLFAGGTGVTFANPIGAVLKALAVTFDATAPNAAELAAAAEVSDAQVEAASRVKDRYDDALLRLPEVVGHGVGRDASGRPVIRLFLKKATATALQAAPRNLEGVPVDTQETGEIRAIPYCGTCAACKK